MRATAQVDGASEPDATPVAAQDARRGLWFAVGAYGLWGVFPIYWKQLGHVAAERLLAHRVVWSFAFVLALVAAQGGLPAARRAWADPRARRALATSTVLISTNWWLFIWAVNGGHILEASLGYYMNPLLNVLVGRVVLGERLSRAQTIGVALAAAGVVNLAVSTGRLPWVSLVLAGSFAAYGLVRKRAPVDARTGLLVETGLVTPLALVFLAVRAWAGADDGAPPLDVKSWALVVGSGVATGWPLLWFAEAAKRLRLSTLGIVQYIAPTLQLACGVLVYGEPFTSAHAVTFALIWSAVALYVVSALRAHTRA